MGETQGQTSEFSAFQDAELVGLYRSAAPAERIDCGCEIMWRFLGRLDLDDLADAPLRGSDGQVVTADGKELMNADYLRVAGDMASKLILNFMSIDETHAQYQEFFGVIQRRVVEHLRV